MPTPEQNKKDFATNNTESFQIEGQKTGDNHLILNIEEDKNEPIILDQKKREHISSGNLLFDIFGSINRYFIIHSSVKSSDKAQFFHLLSVMLNSGIPMLQALKALHEQMNDSPRMKVIIEEVEAEIESGESFSEAALNYPDVFSEQEVGMIEAGEASGRLTDVLSNLATGAEKAHEIKSKIRGAMMYPAVVFGLLIAVVVGMMIFVVPKLSDLFASSGNDLPMLTKVMIAISDFMINHGFIMLAGVLSVSLSVIIFKRTDLGKFYLDKLKLKLPIFGKLFKQAYLARFARSLSNLLESGISIVKTFEIVSISVGNEVYRRRILLAMEDIKQGIPIAENLVESDLFPPMMVSMIDVGEKTAQLSEISEKIAVFYETELDTSVNSLSKIIEPVILILLGVTVGLVVAAIMLPILKLSNIAGSL